MPLGSLGLRLTPAQGVKVGLRMVHGTARAPVPPAELVVQGTPGVQGNLVGALGGRRLDAEKYFNVIGFIIPGAEILGF